MPLDDLRVRTLRNFGHYSIVNVEPHSLIINACCLPRDPTMRGAKIHFRLCNDAVCTWFTVGSLSVVNITKLANPSCRCPPATADHTSAEILLHDVPDLLAFASATVAPDTLLPRQQSPSCRNTFHHADIITASACKWLYRVQHTFCALLQMLMLQWKIISGPVGK